MCNFTLFCASTKKSWGVEKDDFNTLYRPRTLMSLLDTKCQVWHKLSPAAQKRGFACRSMFQKGLPQKSRQRVLREPCIFTPSVMMSDLTTPPPCLRQATVSRGRNRAAPLPTHLLRICAGALYFYSLSLIIGIRRMMSRLPQRRRLK